MVVTTDENFPCFHTLQALEVYVCVHTNPYSSSLRPFLVSGMWIRMRPSFDHPCMFLPMPHMFSCHVAYGTVWHARMRDRRRMLWSYSVNVWEWKIIQLFSIVQPAAMYSHLDILESKGVWSSGKVKYPIILLLQWGDTETVIDIKRVLNEKSQMIFEVPFSPALLTKKCRCFITPKQVIHVSGR